MGKSSHSHCERNRVYTNLSPIISLVIVLLFLSNLAIAQADDEPECKPKFRSMKAIESEECRFELIDFDTWFHISAGTMLLVEEDMYETYGAHPAFKFELSIRTGDFTRFVMGLGYEIAAGDPYYDIIGFQGQHKARLEVIPLSLGTRLDILQNPRIGLLLGADFQAALLYEKLPQYDPSLSRRSRGLGFGYKLSISPEWRSKDRKRAWGATFSFGGVSSDVSSSWRRHDVVTMGMGASFHYSFAI